MHVGGQVAPELVSRLWPGGSDDVADCTFVYRVKNSKQVGVCVLFGGLWGSTASGHCRTLIEQAPVEQGHRY